MSLETLPPLGNRSSTARIGKGQTAFVHHIDPDYFGVMGIPLRRGRTFHANETGAGMVSESFARAMWPGEEALGKVWDDATVVGVVGNAATVALADPGAAEFYHPMDDEHVPRAVMIVRVDGDPSAIAGILAGAARDIDPRVSIAIGLLRNAFDVKLRMPQRMSVIVWALGALALALAAGGLAGLVVLTVSQRAREIGIRMALGARPRDVIDAVLSQFRKPLLWGLAGGVSDPRGPVEGARGRAVRPQPVRPRELCRRRGAVYDRGRRGDGGTVAARDQSRSDRRAQVRIRPAEASPTESRELHPPELSHWQVGHPGVEHDTPVADLGGDRQHPRGVRRHVPRTSTRRALKSEAPSRACC